MQSTDPGAAPAAVELSDEDVLDAMRHIPGYLDISTEDFRAIYRLAHAHAMERMLTRISAAALMLTGIAPVRPAMPLGEAARQLLQQGLKSLPVVDEAQTVIGILTETDFLRCFGAGSALELLLRLEEALPATGRRCRETTVARTMTAPAVTVGQEARADEILRAFRSHPGRSMPVVDVGGRLRGLLLRKDFLHAAHLENGPA